MARSQYVYLFREIEEPFSVLATFTVKWEALRWWMKFRSKNGAAIEMLRFQDGAPWPADAEPKLMDIAAEIEKEKERN